MSGARSKRAWWAGLVIFGVGIAIRANNAFLYPIDMGFDASFNWQYIERLLGSWALPSPEAGWSTSRPPFFYYLSAAIIRGLGGPEREFAIQAVRVVSSLAGLAVVALAVALVRRVDPGNPRRALIAAGLLLFLPVHVYMSAMLNEEILVSCFVSLALVGVAWPGDPGARPGARLWRDAAAGVAAGLAILTKLSGVPVTLTVVATQLLRGWRGGRLGEAVLRVAIFLTVAAVVGGWYYARSWVEHGYLVPYALSTHGVMQEMPPGERAVGDYLRLPLSTWTDPQLLDPDLLRSVWGSTYATFFFDGHRHFLPRTDEGVRRAGTLILLLALLPSAAFLFGLASGARRATRKEPGPDLPLLLLVASTLAGYVLFTWRNPWFVTVKGSYLLGLSVPFAFYGSEVLDRWMRAGSWRSRSILAVCATLALAVALVFSFDFAIAKRELPGLPWQGLP